MLEIKSRHLTWGGAWYQKDKYGLFGLLELAIYNSGFRMGSWKGNSIVAELVSHALYIPLSL